MLEALKRKCFLITQGGYKASQTFQRTFLHTKKSLVFLSIKIVASNKTLAKKDV